MGRLCSLLKVSDMSIASLVADILIVFVFHNESHRHKNLCAALLEHEVPHVLMRALAAQVSQRLAIPISMLKLLSHTISYHHHHQPHPHHSMDDEVLFRVISELLHNPDDQIRVVAAQCVSALPSAAKVCDDGDGDGDSGGIGDGMGGREGQR